PSTRPRSRPVMRSSCGSTPRIPDAASCPPRGASMSSTSPAAPEPAGIPASGPGTPCSRPSIRSAPSSSSPAPTGRRRSPAAALPWSWESLPDEAFPGLGADDVEGIHTQWIEPERRPRREEQKRPAPIAEEELQRLPTELDGKLPPIGLPARLLTALGAAAGAGASGAAASASGEGRESAGGGEDAGAVTAPVPGSLVDYLVDDGAEVEAGDEVAVVSAMKMETRVETPVAGTFRR